MSDSPASPPSASTPSQTQFQSRSLAQLSPTRVLHVGCGNMSKRWLQVAQETPEIELAGLIDLDKNTAMERAGAAGLEHLPIFTDLDLALAEIQPDVVFDVTIPKAHTEVTCKSLEAGAHVFGEKPLADSPENARRSVETARRTGKLYSVMQNRRHLDAAQTLCEVIAGGQLGQIHTICSDFFVGPHFGGFREEMEHVLLLDMAIHTFDSARQYTGADPLSVYCHEWNPPGSWYAHGASAIAVFEMTNDIVYSYRGSWCAEGCSTSWECFWRIIGTEGSLTFDFQGDIILQTVKERGGFQSATDSISIPVKTFPGKNEGHATLIREFIQCVREREAGLGEKSVPETICTDNIKSLEMVFGAVESAESGIKVTLGGLI